MLLATDQFSEEKFGKNAATIALNNFQWNYATLVLLNSTLICSVDVFLRSYQKNVIVGRGTFYPGFVKRIRQFVIFGADLSDIVHMLTWMQIHEFDNTGIYIVVCMSEQQDKCNAANVLNTLWNHKIINVVLINHRNDKTVNGFTYYHPEDCKNIRPTNVKNWDSCLLQGHKYCQNMYPLKLKNLHGCPIIVSTFNHVPYMTISNGVPTGVDGDLLRLIAKAMNFSLVIMNPRIGYGWGIFQDNGTWTGSLGDVYNEWANFSMTFACMTVSRFKHFHMSSDYSVITIVWVTHPSKPQPSSLKLFRPFQADVRIAICVTFVIVVLCKLFLKTKGLSLIGHKVNIRFPDNIILYLWELCVGLPVSTFPTNKAFVCLTVFWTWYCYLIRTLYQVYLINSLQTDVYAPKFDTIEESIASQYEFGGGLSLRDYYIDNALVYDGWKKVESVEIHPVIEQLSQGLKFVLAVSIETINMFSGSNPDNKLHVLPRVVVTCPTAIFFKKYSPLVDPLNVILSRLRESGIIEKLHMNNIDKKLSEQTLNNQIPITMEHCTGCYVILLSGWLLSGLCFVIEKLTMTKKNLIKNNMITYQ